MTTATSSSLRQQSTTQPHAHQSVGASVRVSDRVRLAQLSRDAALAMIGVAGADRGPAGLFVTAGDNQQVDGVRCVAAGNGRYEVSLRLRCELMPLLAVADGVRTAVRRTAAAAGIALADVNVLIADVVDPERS